MEIINHRYRLAQKLEDGSNYICSDIWDGDKLLKLTIIDKNSMSKELQKYYIEEFIGISRLDNEAIIKNYSFDIFSDIDNKSNLEEEYLYTSEYVEDSQSLLTYIEGKDVFEIMEVFSNICKTVHYLHINGYVYGSINLNNISIVKTGGEDCLKFKDLATVRLEQESFDKNDMKGICFELCDLLSIKPSDRRFDMYSVGILLITMLNKTPSKSSPKELIQIFRSSILSEHVSYSKKEINFLVNLLPIVEKLLGLEEDYPYRYLYDFIDEINEKTGKHYNIVDKENLEKLNLYTKLIGREEITHNIVKAYENRMDYKGDEKVYFIEGNSGIGKTRILKELQFLLRLKSTGVYSSFKLNNLNDDRDMWEEIVDKLMLSSDKDRIRKFRSDLRIIVPRIKKFNENEYVEFFKDSKQKYKILNRVGRFIIESLKDKASAVLIDNIHLADEFSIDLLKYIYAEIKNDKNIILIFSYKENKTEDNKKFLDFIGNIRRSNNSVYFKLQNLTIDETGKMIQNILTMDHIPKILASKIYSKSYGNPLFISEIIKDLYANNKIFILQQSGLWHIELPEGDVEYNDLHIPNNLEQVLLNQLNGISSEEHMIVNTTSISFNPISLEHLNSLLDIEEEVLKSKLDELINKGVLHKDFKNHKATYEITNKVLDDIIYERIEDDVRVKTHKAASLILEKEIEEGGNVDLDELIYHLKGSNEIERLRKYLLINSEKKYESRNLNEAIISLESALEYIDENDIEERIKLVLKISEMYLEIESVECCMESLNYAESLAAKIGDIKTELKVYISKTEIYMLKGDDEKTSYCMDKVSGLLKRTDDFKSFLRYKSFTSILLLKKGKNEEVIEICNNIISLAKEDFVKLRGHVYRIMGLAYVNLNQFDKAISLNEKSVELLESAGYVRGVVYSLNNIGTIYHDNYQDLDRALEYYKETIEKSRENNILSGELLALINTASILYDKHEYKSSFEYCEKALNKSLEADYQEDTIYLYRMMTSLSLNMNKFTQAEEYYKLSIKYTGTDKYLNNDLKLNQAEFYYAFGEFDKALKYTKESIDNLMDTQSTVRYIFGLKHCLLKIIFSDHNDCECSMQDIIDEATKIELTGKKVLELSKIVQCLWRKNDYKNANQIFSLLEASMHKDLHPEAKSVYYYTKGLVTQGDESLECFNKAFRIANKIGNKLLEANIKMEIGNYYYDKNKDYKALNSYISSAEIIRTIIYDIPDEYKLSFVNGYNYGSLFKRIEDLEKILLENEFDEKVISKREENFKLKSLEDLKQLLSQNYDLLAEDKDFMKRYKANHLLETERKISDERSVIDNLDNHIVRNLELILNYMKNLSLATNVAIVLGEENHNLSVVASVGESDNIEGNRYIFERLRSSMNPILASSKKSLNEYEVNFLREDLKASVYIPIAGGYSQYYLKNSNSDIKRHVPKIQGYLYLETSNTLNNFNKEAFRENLGLMNLIAILCEKYVLRKLATIDKLTGALTRKYLEDELEDLVKSTKLSQGKSSIIMYDLDRFKRVNDTFGHQTGDEVLQKVSKLVMDDIDKFSSLGRYGGEEFVVVLPDTDTPEALKIADYLREKIYRADILGELASVSVSCGIATYPVHGTTAHQLIERADQALYSAKENGRNRCEVWTRNIVSKTKPISKLDGIITGDDVRDSRNILAIVETIELINSNLEEEEIIDAYLARLLETLEGEYGYLILIEDGKPGKRYEKKARQEKGSEHFNLNEEVAEEVIKTRQAIYMIDWDYVRKDSLKSGLPVWNSILVVPIIKKDLVIGLIYLLVSTKSKEFGINDLNFAMIYGNLLQV